ncbi:MAG: 50S ribosomal protein L15 [Chlamydiales bacterium]
MITLDSLKNTTRGRISRKRVGRGPGSGLGKTSGRGQKGAGARSGYRRRLGYEGGQMRLHMKMPQRGFSNVRFQKRLEAINLSQIEEIFQSGDVVNESSLREHGLITGKCHGIKILGNGELKKKVTIEANAFSNSAKEKLEKESIDFKQVS